MDVCPTPFAVQQQLPRRPFIKTASWTGPPNFFMEIVYDGRTFVMDQTLFPDPTKYEFKVDGVVKPLAPVGWADFVDFLFISAGSPLGTVATIQCLAFDPNTRNTAGVMIGPGPVVDVTLP